MLRHSHIFATSPLVATAAVGPRLGCGSWAPTWLRQLGPNLAAAVGPQLGGAKTFLRLSYRSLATAYIYGLNYFRESQPPVPLNVL